MSRQSATPESGKFGRSATPAPARVIARHIQGAATFLALLLSTSFWIVPVLTLGLLKLLLPEGELRNRTIMALASLGEGWTATNVFLMSLFLRIDWDVEGFERLDRAGRYLIVSNHQSWTDILVLFRVFHRRVPFIRFFMKSALIWVPLVGVGCWALEYPFVRRYSAEYLEKHPEKRGVDIQTTRRACRRFRRIPVAMLIFLEGTRFTREKHQEQDVPYRYLLRPRVGGIGHALATMGDQIGELLDVTIVYDRPDATFWDFVSNRICKVTVRIRRITIPENFRDDRIVEPGAEREAFKQWLNELWSSKDRVIHSVVSS